MSERKRKPPEPQFGIIHNSDLVCVDCIYRHEADMASSTCKMFPFPKGKPNDVLDGGPCNKKKVK